MDVISQPRPGSLIFLLASYYVSLLRKHSSLEYSLPSMCEALDSNISIETHAHTQGWEGRQTDRQRGCEGRLGDHVDMLRRGSEKWIWLIYMYDIFKKLNIF